MNRDIIREGLLCLQEEGWSDLIDSRWKDEVIKEIKGRLPIISDEALNELLNLDLIEIGLGFEMVKGLIFLAFA